MVDLGGNLLVWDGIVEPPQLGDGPVFLLPEGGHLGVLLLLGLGGFGLLLGGAGGLIHLVGKKGLAHGEGNERQPGAQDVVQRGVQGKEQGVAQPDQAHQVDGQDGDFFVGGHDVPPHRMNHLYFTPKRREVSRKLEGFAK